MCARADLDIELERRAAELEKEKAEIPARQGIRNRYAVWKEEDALHQQKLKRIQTDCKHPTGTQGSSRMVSDGGWYSEPRLMAKFTCADCGLTREISVRS